MIEKLFRARWILPISRPPIKDGWVLTRGHDIVDVGEGGGPPSGYPIEDLGDAAILPGLINAHTHLEFSSLTQPLGFAGIKLFDWIGLVLALRNKRRRDPGKIIAAGLEECRLAGTRLVGEIATTPWAGFRNRQRTETVAFAEILGFSSERADEKLAAAAAHLSKSAVNDHLAGAISPHAPYSTSLETVRRSVKLACRHRTAVAMHVAECEEERELIERGSGPFGEKLKQLGLFRSEYFPLGDQATLEVLKILAQAPAALIIHGNDLNPQELDFIVEHPNMTVVYCPRTHAFFGHSRHPVDRLLSRGAPVALGTDSRASNPDLSIWNEVRWLLQRRPDIAWQDILAMATIHGANALLRPDLGRIAPGAASGLIAVPGQAADADALAAQWISSGAPRLLTTDTDEPQAS